MPLFGGLRIALSRDLDRDLGRDLVLVVDGGDGVDVGLRSVFDSSISANTFKSLKSAWCPSKIHSV